MRHRERECCSHCGECFGHDPDCEYIQQIYNGPQPESRQLHAMYYRLAVAVERIANNLSASTDPEIAALSDPVLEAKVREALA